MVVLRKGVTVFHEIFPRLEFRGRAGLRHDSRPPRCVGYTESAMVSWLSGEVGIADRKLIEIFVGGHSIHGDGTFDFFHCHLAWRKSGGR